MGWVRIQVLEDGALGVLIAMTAAAAPAAATAADAALLSHDKFVELPTGVLPSPSVPTISLPPAPATDEICFPPFTEGTAAEYATLMEAAEARRQARRRAEAEAAEAAAAAARREAAGEAPLAGPRRGGDEGADALELESRARAGAAAGGGGSSAELATSISASRVAKSLEAGRDEGVLRGLELCPEARRGPVWGKVVCLAAAQGSRMNERPPR
jgi:hypothetical protein